MKAELVDLKLYRFAETDRAVLVSDNEDEELAVWIPKSQVEINTTDRRSVIQVTMPEWLAIQKRFV